jgi:multiple sugar transport system ATP-binding protein
MGEVRLDQVRKVYGNGHVAIAGADFQVADGELLVLVGPSGCGKSTLLRMIAGLESITEGTLSIDGRVVNACSPKERDIAMVFQSYALYPHMTVEGNLAFGLRLRGRPAAEIDRCVRDAAQLLGLTELLDHRPATLSGGQRQRVALGRAIVRNPRVFLLDEPLSNLDAKLRLSMRTEIAKLQRSLRATMIYVTHDQIEAMTLGSRIVVLDRGVIQQIDAPMRLYDQPSNLFVAGFFGSPAMNFLRGTLLEQGDAYLACKDGKVDLGDFLRINPQLSDRVGKTIVVGVRPEDIRIAQSPRTTEQPQFIAKLEYIEPVGNEVFLNLRLGTNDMILRMAPVQLPATGADVHLSFTASKLHCFDPESGLRLNARQPPTFGAFPVSPDST